MLAVAISLFLIGFFTMINRRKALTQVLALLSLENGLFLAAISLTYGMPLIVELGISLRCAGGGHGAWHSRLPHPRNLRVDGCEPVAEVARIACCCIALLLIPVATAVASFFVRRREEMEVVNVAGFGIVFLAACRVGRAGDGRGHRLAW
jgi:hypothetical protein